MPWESRVVPNTQLNHRHCSCYCTSNEIMYRNGTKWKRKNSKHINIKLSSLQLMFIFRISCIYNYFFFPYNFLIYFWALFFTFHFLFLARFYLGNKNEIVLWENFYSFLHIPVKVFPLGLRVFHVFRFSSIFFLKVPILAQIAPF